MVQAANHIAGSSDSTAAPISSSALRPTAADGTRLRRVVLLDFYCSGRLVVEELDQLPVARLADRLGVARRQLLCRVVERFPHEALCVGELDSDLASSL